jgi:formaldehyde-activating enzyme involved in methanogenesis
LFHYSLSQATLAVLVGEEEEAEEEAVVEGLELLKEKPYISRLNPNLAPRCNNVAKKSLIQVWQ